MGLMGNSKWGPGSSDASTPETEAPKAPRNNRAPSGRHEFTPVPPQGDHFSDAPRNHNNRRRGNNNNDLKSRQPLAERITLENPQSHAPPPIDTPTGPRQDLHQPPNKAAVTGRLESPQASLGYQAFERRGTGIHYGYSSAKTPASASEHITRGTAQPYTSFDSSVFAGTLRDRPSENKEQEVTERIGNGIDHGYGGTSKSPVYSTARYSQDRPTSTARRQDFQPAVTPVVIPDGRRIAKTSSVKKVVSFVSPPQSQTDEGPAKTKPATVAVTPTTRSTSTPATAPSSSRAAILPLAPRQSVSTAPAITVLNNTIYHIPSQANLSDADFRFLLSKLQGRKISAADWDFAVQRVQSFDVGTPLGVEAQHGTEIPVETLETHSQNIPTLEQENQKSILAESRVEDSSSFAPGEEVVQGGTILRNVQKQEDLGEKENEAKEPKAHSSPDFWDKFKQKLDAVDDMKLPVSAAKQVEIEDAEEEW